MSRAAALSIVMLLSGTSSALQAPPPAPEVSLTETLRRRLESPRPATAAAPLARPVEVASFYAGRGFATAWSPERLQSLETAVRDLRRDGLRPADYRLDELSGSNRLLAAGPEARVDRELAATDAFFTLVGDLAGGRVDTASLGPEWVSVPRTRDPAMLLGRALADGPATVLEALRPDHRAYRRLGDRLLALEKVADGGGWPTFAPERTLRPGDEGADVAALAARLRASADLTEDPPDLTRFDAVLEAAVTRFQERHGLDPDGVVGAKTAAELAVPAAARVRQLEVNLERWRWLPESLGADHVLVNIAGYDLQLVRGGETLRHHRVVVGRGARKTPVFSGRITHLVVNPSWHVPPKLAREDLVPEIRKDPTYLERKNITVLSGWGADARVLDPATVDWQSRGVGSSLRFRQEPGPLNALGQVKFMFPNGFNVYLHDTPSRELFSRARRDFSSGCIRVQDALELAVELLDSTPGWDRGAVAAVAAAAAEKTVVLREAVPVHLLYWTAWADEAGLVHFRPDIYQRDAAVAAALAGGS